MAGAYYSLNRIKKVDQMKSPRPDRLENNSVIEQKMPSMTPLGAFVRASLAGGVVLILGYYLSFTGNDDSRTIGILISLVAYLSAACWFAVKITKTFPHAILGYCNFVTLSRLVIVAVLFAALLDGHPPSWTTLGLSIGALTLDGVDGWLARKQDLESDFGARFDVEVDAAFALLLAVFAAVHGAAGLYVILLGFPYYLFGAAKIFLPWLDRTLPNKFSRKTICVFQIGALITLQVPFFAAGQLDLLIGAVTVALIWSFGTDTLWLWRNAK